MDAGKRHTGAVDSDLLAFTESARQRLADELFRRGRRARWNEVSLAHAVDRVLIRFVFLRMCEDRGVRLSAREYGSIEKAAGPTPFPKDLREPDDVLDFAPGLAREWPSSRGIAAQALGSVYETFLGTRLTLARSGPRLEPATQRRKHAGAFYTPQYIVDYIVEETVGKLIAGKSPAEMSGMRFLDPACGAGRFLMRVYERLLEEHTGWFGRQEKVVLPFAARRQILANCVFGVDLDEQAVEVTRLSLILKLLEDGGDTGLLAQELPNLTANIRYGNSLVAPGPLTPDGIAGFAWEEEFPQVFGSGGFDVVVGNPPYGAQLSPEMRSYLADRFDVETTDTAALMMVHSLRDLTRPGGANGFIVPKAFTYSSNWERVRGELSGGMTALVDVGKVWPKVKLEQVVYVAQKNTSTATYRNRRREGERFCDITEIQKEHCAAFGFLLNGITDAEVRVGEKIHNAGSFLGEYVTNTRGAMFQDRVVAKGRGRRVIGGKQIQRFQIDGEKGFVRAKANLEENAIARPGSILVQNIVAHIEHPVDHIKIAAAIACEDVARQIVILDTVNQLTNNSALSSYFFLAILNSRLMNWYVYRFIYAKAIRTMHFDGPVTSRIPIPRITAENKALYREIVAAARALKSNASCEAGAAIERGLQALYGLNARDIGVIERGMPEMSKRSATASRP